MRQFGTGLEGIRQQRAKLKRKRTVGTIIFLVIIVAVIAVALNTASFKRFLKSLRSDLGGGLNRTVTVYDYNGQPIKQYDGKFDIQENDTKVFFDMDDGRRISIYNAVVIAEENLE